MLSFESESNSCGLLTYLLGPQKVTACIKTNCQGEHIFSRFLQVLKSMIPRVYDKTVDVVSNRKDYLLPLDYDVCEGTSFHPTFESI